MSELKIDVKKIMGESPKNGFEAIDKLNEANQCIIEALHIMISAIDNPTNAEGNTKRMLDFVSKFRER